MSTAEGAAGTRSALLPRALSHPRTPSTRPRRSFCRCPVRNQKRPAVKGLLLQAGSFRLSWEGNSLYPNGTAPGSDWAPGFSAAALPLHSAGIWGLPYGFPSAPALSTSSLPAPDTLEHGAPGNEQPELVWTTQEGGSMGRVQGTQSFSAP